MSHPTIPQAEFAAAFPVDPEWDHPLGRFLVRALESALKAEGRMTTPIDDWRDSGWSLGVIENGREFDVVFAAMADRGRWLLQVFPRRRVGLWARLLLGRKDPDTRAEVRSLARSVDAALRRLPEVQDLYWQVAAPPDPAKGVPTPDQLPWP